MNIVNIGLILLKCVTKIKVKSRISNTVYQLENLGHLGFFNL